MFISSRTTSKIKQGQKISFRPSSVFDYNQRHEMQDFPNRYVYDVAIDHHYQMNLDIMKNQAHDVEFV